MTRFLTALLIVLLVVLGFGFAASMVAQTGNVLGSGERADCRNFRTVEDATAVSRRAVDTDGRDIYGLDGAADSDDTACEHSDLLGDGPFASCANFVDQRHAQALYDATDGVGYNLAVVNGVACPESDLPPTQPPPTRPSPTEPTPRTVSTTGCDSTLVENGRVTICAGQDIDVQPFDFDAFAARAQDGFGHFSGSGTSGPISIGVPSGVPSSAPASGTSGTTTLQQANEGGNQVLTTEQKAKAKKKSKAKAKKGKRGKEGKKGKRDRRDDRGRSRR